MKILVSFSFSLCIITTTFFAQSLREIEPTYFTKSIDHYSNEYKTSFKSDFRAVSNCGIIEVGAGEFSITTRKHVKKEDRLNVNEKFQFNITTFHWFDFNESATIQPINKTGSIVHYDKSEGLESFKELHIKNLYDGIDIIYELPKEGGIKYSLYLSPNSNSANIKLDIKGVQKELQENGTLFIKNGVDSFIDYSPNAFYQDTKELIDIKYIINSDGIVSFELGNYDHSRSIVIDPWVVSLNSVNLFAGGIKQDDLGNTYVTIGNSALYSFELRKYSPANVLLWTFINPNMEEIGMAPSLEVNPTTGTSYFLSNPGGEPLAVNTSGTIVWSNTFTGAFAEAFAFRFNCEYDELIAVGRPLIGVGQRGFGTINISSGTTLASFQVGAGLPVANNTNECRGVCADNNGGYLLLGRSSVIGICPDKSVRFETYINPVGTPWFDYNGNYLVTNGTPGVLFSGIESSYQNYIYAGVSAYYVTMGDVLYKFDIQSGNILGSVVIPGGVREAGSGIVVDNCENIFVGGMTGIHRFDSNLNYLGLIATSGAVIDLDFSTTNNEIIAGGVGFFGSFSSIVCPSIICSITINDTIPDVTICQGSSTVLTTLSGTSYSWSPNNDISDNSIQSPVVSPSITTTYYVQVNQSCGIHYDTILVTVETCGLNATIDALQDTICTGECTVLAGESNGGISPYSYSWEGGAFLSIDTFVVCPSITTSYQLIVMDGAGDLDTVYKTIHVNEFPTVDLGQDIQTCGNQVVLNAVVSLPNATLLWNTNSNTSQINVTNSDMYWVNAMNGSCIDSDTVNVNLINFQIDLGPDLDTCVPTVALSLPTINNYSWIDGTQANTFLASVPGTYWVNSTDPNGCTDSDTISFITGTISVSLGNDLLLCEGEMFVANPSVSDDGSGTFLWNNQSSSSSLEIAQSGLYSVQYINGICSSHDTIEVIFFKPNAEFAPPINGCEPLNVSFDNNSITPYSNLSAFEWNFGDQSTSSLQNPQHTYTSSGIFTTSLIVSTPEGCSDTTTHSVYVYPKPIANFSFLVNEDNSITTFDNNSINGLIYHWDFGDGASSNLVNPTHQYQNDGNYQVTLTVETEFGCISEVTYLLSVTKEFVFFVPNAFTPDDNGVNNIFKAEGQYIKSFAMEIYDRWGEKIWSANSLEDGWDGNYNGEKCQDGIYTWVVLFTDNKGIKHEFLGHVVLLR